MSLQTNLRGRLRNTSLPKKHGLMPVFEAVVNSIHSIEEAENISRGKISLRILRRKQTSLKLGQEGSLEPILGFEVIDNGCGFNDDNFKSFGTLDSEHKIEKGCRGVGRLMWLKAFDHVDVESKFMGGSGALNSRVFRFDTSGVQSRDIQVSDIIQTGTKLTMNGFDKSYRKSVPVKVSPIATQLLEHCLWYFVREEGAPEIIVSDGECHINLHELYDRSMHAQFAREDLDICEHKFTLTHLKFRASVNKKHQLSFCAANRLVKEESIQGKLPGLYSKLSDENGEFIYTCYISSKYLDDNVRSERTSFNISEQIDGIFSNSELSLKKIREVVLERTAEYLGKVLENNVEEGKKRVEEFISKKAPRYRPIVRYVSQDKLVFDPDKSDKELELHLHEHWYEVERQLLNDGHDIMLPNKEESIEAYKSKLNNYLQKAEDVKKSDLANYIFHRKTIVDLMQATINQLDDGKYAREDIIHELIMPMGKESSEVFGDSCNLWLIDERLAFHHYLSSDKTIKSMPITSSSSAKEPDLLSFRVFDNPVLINNQESFPMGSITVVEIKRPMRNDMKEGEDKNPIEQSLGYLERVREGKVKTKNGHIIPPAVTKVPGYCYIVCDLTNSMIRRCKLAGLKITADGMGYFGYNEPYESYIEVISFNQLIRAAKERNRAFFDKLGLPTN